MSQLDLTPAASFAMHARLIPAFYLERVAQTQTVSAGKPLCELAERLRTPLFEPGGAFAALTPTTQRQLQHQAQRLRRCSSGPVPMSRGETGICR